MKSLQQLIYALRKGMNLEVSCGHRGARLEAASILGIYDTILRGARQRNTKQEHQEHSNIIVFQPFVRIQQVLTVNDDILEVGDLQLVSDRHFHFMRDKIAETPNSTLRT